MPKSKKSLPILSSLPEVEIYKLATTLSDQTFAEMSQLLSIWGITPLQYHALYAIYIYDIDKNGLSNNEITQQVNVRVPDMTRLLDRMEAKKWLIRSRDQKNKRIVRSKLTSIGTTLVTSALHPLHEMYTQQYSGLNSSEKTTLTGLLKKANT